MKLIKEKKIYTGDGVIENGYIRFDEKIEEVGDMAGFEPKEGDLEVTSGTGAFIIGILDLLTFIVMVVMGKITWMLHRMRLMRWLSR